MTYFAMACFVLLGAVGTLVSLFFIGALVLTGKLLWVLFLDVWRNL